MSRRWKIPAIMVSGVLIISTPFFWLLDDPNTGQLVAACVQCFTGVVALIPVLFPSPSDPESEPADTAIHTGKAKTTAGGNASTGIKRPRGEGKGSARAERTGDANADGPGSSASTGVDYG